MEIDPRQLTQCVDRVSTISTDKSRGIKFTLGANKLTLSAQSPDAGFAKEEIDVNYDANSVEIGFNSRYVLEMLNQLEGDTAQFLFSDANSPAVVTDPSDVRALYVIMPMRV
jgi:DNA polymerase-3 subunit beta